MKRSSEGALEIGSFSLVRTSRFNNKDYYTNLCASENPSQKVILLDRVSLEYKDVDYVVERAKFFEDKQIKLLCEALKVKNLLIFKINYDEVTRVEYREGSIKTGFAKIDYTKTNINEVLFDPYVGDINFFNPDIREAFINQNKSVEIANWDLILLTGEYVMANPSNRLLEDLFATKSYAETEVYLDKFGFLETILGTLDKKFPLFMLHKRYLISHVKYLPNIQNNKTMTEKNGETRHLYFENGKGFHILDNEEKFSEKNYQLLLVGKNFPIGKEIPFDQNTVINRTDDIMDTRIQKMTVNYPMQNDFFLKLFDYHDAGAFESVRLNMLEGEKVRIGDKVATISDATVPFIRKHIISPKEGTVSFKYLKQGYVLVKNKTSIINKKFQCGLRVRPRIILGSNQEGILENNIFFVSVLDQKAFTKFIQKGAKAIICEAIEQSFYEDVSMYQLDNLATIVVLDGIGVAGGSHNFFEFGNNKYIIKIDVAQKLIYVGYESKKKKLIFDKFALQDRYNVGDYVRMIDDQEWGHIVKVVAKTEQEVVVQGKSKTIVSIINLL